MTSEVTKQTIPATTLTTALQSARVIDTNPQQLEYTLAQAMAKAFADMGINTANRQDEITYLVQTMPTQVTQALPCLKLSEIPVAINNGILRQYGEFFGLNVATFMHFLIEHYKSNQRAQAVKASLAAAALPTPAPTAAQLQQTRARRITTAFKLYKMQKYYHDYGSLVFDAINATGKIPFTAEKEAAILEQARLSLIKQYSKISVYPDERQKLRANLGKILQGNGATLILTEAKRIALTQLFDLLIAEGLEIMDFLKLDV